MVKNHFVDLFKMTGNRNFSPLISLVPHLVSKDVNQILCKEVCDDDIFKAAKKLGAMKAPGKDGYLGFYFVSIVGAQVCSDVKEFLTQAYCLPG